MDKYRVGVIQMDSSGKKEENLMKARAMIEEAAQNGAVLVSLPEVFESVSLLPEEQIPEKIPGEAANMLMELAKKNHIWIHGGSIREENLDGNHPFNTTLLINPSGEIEAKYRKLHLFDISLENGSSFKESDQIAPGMEIVTAETELGNLGLSICYDLRFPELYRIMALRGAQVLFVAADFTHMTGLAHWEPLLRARAIENGAYVIAAGQTGIKGGKNVSHGQSMVVDPWGKIVAQAEFSEKIIYAEIDLNLVGKIRDQIPSLKNCRHDIY